MPLRPDTKALVVFLAMVNVCISVESSELKASVGERISFVFSP
ncbi:hypothetical protein HCBG_01853 [Histoplasma capsulatum G186AR]|uniref:Uncharacterized protein n=1 Tax=Ajellomyces capsulatus (strain G186AR / H82 / ATCC MYA-2454 / RMSCC 2432) TaxID=447093 RepID=C0NG37_AJECG|nr:uncharacterized protein HCBG_01853 [Histoplasma capsulatum G186AR]EEH10208.1 hypothetical protein HCBG_01853 [Histoplasma capsulatum G186AR]